MPDNDLPATKPDPEEMPGEFDFAKPVEENPRVRRRSLRPGPATSLKPASGAPAAARELASEAPPFSAVPPKSKLEPGLEQDVEAETEAETSTTPTTAPSRPSFSSTAKPSKPASAGTYPRVNSTTTNPTPASPHGTRPATLYYSTSVRKDKEETSPMKSTPTSSPTSSTPAPSTSPTRPAATAAPGRVSSVVDYRTNVERQAREQKSVGGVLSILVYSLIAFFVLGAALAGYGAYVVSVQLHQQTVTVSQLDDKYAAANKELNAKLASTLDTLTEAEAQIGRQQELILKEQETINKLLATTQESVAAIRQEKQARAEETSSLRARIKDLEYQASTTRKY